MKNILVISSSPEQKDSNSEEMGIQFMKGAEAAGHKTELVKLRDYNLEYCIGCYACTSGRCFKDDGINEIMDKMRAADVIVFCTPVYFYTMSGQMKVFIDRLMGCYMQIKADIYLFASAYDTDQKLLALTLESLRGCTRDCFVGCEEKGAMVIGGLGPRGSLKNHPKLKEIYEMGLKA